MKATILHLLIGARLIHVASPEYRKRKAERKVRKAEEKAELNEMANSEPLKFVTLLLCAICALGIPFFLFYPDVSAWWALVSLVGALVSFVISIIVSDVPAASPTQVEPTHALQGERVFAPDFLKKYKRFGTIPADVEFDLVNRTEDYVFVPSSVIDACIAAEQNSNQYELPSPYTN